MFDFSNYSDKSKYYRDSKTLVVSEMKDEMGGNASEEFVGLEPKMYSTLANIKSKRRN